VLYFYIWRIELCLFLTSLLKWFSLFMLLNLWYFFVVICRSLFISFGHCIISPSMSYCFLLLIWYIHTKCFKANSELEQAVPSRTLFLFCFCIVVITSTLQFHIFITVSVMLWQACSGQVWYIVGSIQYRVNPKTKKNVFVLSPLFMQYYRKRPKTSSLWTSAKCSSGATCLPVIYCFSEVEL
jgi:hypothetical protein